jgi:uncharacterized protein (TIGR03067 family)
VTINGSESPLSTHTFIFDADSGVRTIFNGNSASTWEVTLDMTASPRTMKWVSPGRANSSDWDCVYELSGNTLKVGFVRKGATPVKVEPADGLTLYVMTRDTTAK